MWSFLLITTLLHPLPPALPLLRRPLISHFISSAFRLLQHEISQTTKRKREIQLRKLLGNLLAWKWDKVMCEGGRRLRVGEWERKHLEREAATEIQKMKKAKSVSTLFLPSGIKFIAPTREENWIEEGRKERGSMILSIIIITASRYEIILYQMNE